MEIILSTNASSFQTHRPRINRESCLSQAGTRATRRRNSRHVRWTVIVFRYSKHSLRSVRSLGQSRFPDSGNPFANVGRAVSKFDSVGFCNAKRPDGFKAHHRDLLDIYRQSALRCLLVLSQLRAYLDVFTASSSTP